MGDTRTQRTGFRTGEAEKLMIEEEARRDFIRPSEWVRKVVMQEIDRRRRGAPAPTQGAGDVPPLEATRVCSIPVRVREDEKTAIYAEAEADYTKPSPWLRAVVMREVNRRRRDRAAAARA